MTVSDYRNTVCDPHHFIQFMTDKYYRNISLLQTQNNIKQAVYFVFRQCCRRFIHKQQLCIQSESPADCNNLSVGNGQFFHRHIKRQTDTDQSQCFLRYLFDFFFIRQWFSLFDQLVHSDIIRHTHCIKKTQILKYNLNALINGIFCRMLRQIRAIDLNRTGSSILHTGNNFYKSRLPAAIFACQTFDFAFFYRNTDIIKGLNSHITFTYMLCYNNIIFICHKMLPLIDILKSCAGVSTCTTCSDNKYPVFSIT